MSDCLFCRMVSRQIPTTIVYETERVFAFRDIRPQAPVHVLVIPKEHIATLDDAQPEHAAVLGEVLWVAQQVARQEGIAESGYRLAMNCKGDAGQTVYHVHLHVLGGRKLGWPPG